jgi:colanic acid/amylovoran biosynthesis glycosyltransferase
MQSKKVINPHCIVFRDKILLPSEGFIQTHYHAFNKLRPVYLANKLGWHENEIKEKKILTSTTSIGQFWFKQTGTLSLKNINNLNPQVIHAHFGRGGALVLPLAQKLGLPLYVTYHGGDATKYTHQKSRIIPTIYQRRLKNLQSYANGFLCVSKFIAQRLADQGFPRHKLITHYIGINCKNIIKPTIKNGPMLFVGRLTKKKGVDLLLKAIRKLQEKKGPLPSLYIAGSGSQEASLKKLANGLKTIKFIGWQNHIALQKLMKDAQAVIVPSREADDGDCEGLPTVILEAIRAGTVVIATNHAGIPEIIEDKVSGLLTPEGDINALADSLQYVMLNQNKIVSFVKTAQSRLIKDFNATKQSKRLQEILLGKSRPNNYDFR